MNSENCFKKICLLIFVFLMVVASAKAAPTAYAEYSGGTFTFKYGEMPTGKAYCFDVSDTGHRFPQWAEIATSIKTVVFDSSFSSARPNSCYYWFYGCEKLKEIKGIENLNTSDVTSMYAMFDNCYELTDFDISGFNTSSVTSMGAMFTHCSSLTSLDLSGFNTSNVTDMNIMFRGCKSLTSLDVSGFNTSKVTDMMGMFDGCSSLTSLDVSSFNTSNVADMGIMFHGCSSLTSLDVSSFNTSKVTDMNYMFCGCTKLISLDVSGFNTSKVTDMHSMFRSCNSLTSLDISGFNTSNVTDMDYMFCSCTKLMSLDLRGLNTSKVTDMHYMFYGCSGLRSLDLRGLNTSNVTDMRFMFSECSSLTTIYCNDSWDSSCSSDDMFSGCDNLKGVIAYDSWKTNNAVYANPTTGYFTYKAVQERPLSVCGTTVTELNEKNFTTIDGVMSGSAKYDNSTKTLTLTDAVIYTNADNTSAILTNLDSLYIVVNGECMIGSLKLAGIAGTSHVVIKGDGKLTVMGKGAVALYMDSNSLTVADGVQLDIQGHTLYGINGCKALKVSGKDTKLRVYGATGSCTNVESMTLSDNLAIMEPLGAKYSNGTIVGIDGNEIKNSWVTIEYAEPYDLTLNGTQVTAANNSILSTIPGVTGTASYDPDTKTLYLEDASITELTSTGGYALHTTLDTLRINVTGDCSISSSKGTGIFANSRNVVISGTGTLDITAGANGIVMNNASTNTLDIDGKVTVNVTADSYGIQGREYIQRVGLTGTTKTYYRTTLKVGGEGSKLSVNGTAKCFQTLGGFSPAEGYKVTAPSRTAYYGTVERLAYNTFCRSTLVIPGIGKTQTTTVTLTPVAGTAVVIEKPYILGDVNGDGSVTENDIVKITQYVLGTSHEIDTAAADVNVDGSVTVTDIVYVTYYILYGVFPSQAQAKAFAAEWDMEE